MPNRFDGTKLDQDLCTAHYLSFRDYLEIQKIDQPQNQTEINNVVKNFRRTLQGQARLWIEEK